jgi:hypothetical protein
MQLSGTVGKYASERSKFSGALRCSLSTFERDSDRSNWRARSAFAEAIGYYSPTASSRACEWFSAVFIFIFFRILH